jgi:hypothetical protein
MTIDVTGDGSPEFEPTNVVEQQLLAAANGDLEQQKAFERFILDETLYVATPEAPAEETVTVSQGESIALLNVLLDDGRQAAAVFTAPQRVAEAFGEVGAIGIQGRILFEMIRATPAVLNPGQAYGVVWEPETLAAMLGLPTERTIEKETRILLGSPADPPAELVDRLKATFGGVPHVEAAWLALAAWPETQTQSWYLDVRTSSADHEPIRRALPDAVEGADMHGRPLDLVINPVGQTEGVGIVIVEPAGRPEPAKKQSLLGRLFG